MAARIIEILSLLNFLLLCLRRQKKKSINNIPTASVVQWSGFLATDPEIRIRFLPLPDFLRNIGSGTGFTHPREYN
jgi:hypothetical protein